MSEFLKNINRQKFLFILKYIIILLLIVIIINVAEITYSKYSSNAEGNAVANIAFFIVDVGTVENSISLAGLVPSETDYLYRFSVNNFKNNKRANVNLDYSIEFQTTTNLPLTFKIFRENEQNDVITSTEIIQDGDMYFKKLNTDEAGYFTHDSNQTDNYVLVVNFPIEYNVNSDEYQGLIDSFIIKINATQRI